MTSASITEAQRLRLLAKLLAPTFSGSNEAMAKMDDTLDRLSQLIPLDEFEDFVSGLWARH